MNHNAVIAFKHDEEYTVVMPIRPEAERLLAFGEISRL